MGTVTAVNGGPPQPGTDPSFDPSSCSSLWQCYQVQWDNGSPDSSCPSTAEAMAATGQVSGMAGDADGNVTTAATGADAGVGSAAAEAGAVAAEDCRAGVTGTAAAGGGSCRAACWCSPWELYAVGASTEQVVAAECEQGLSAEQVRRCWPWVVLALTTTRVWWSCAVTAACVYPQHAWCRSPQSAGASQHTHTFSTHRGWTHTHAYAESPPE